MSRGRRAVPPTAGTGSQRTHSAASDDGAMPRLPQLTSRRARWAVPVVAAAALAGVGPLATTLTASAHGSLPPRTAAQLLVDVQNARVQGLSGTVVETSDLGLPSLPNLGGQGGGSSSFSSLVSGSHTMRVWYAGPGQVRMALLGQLGESDLVRNGGDVWAWSSDTNTATHWTAPAAEGAQPTVPGPADGPVTPQQAAEAALKAIDPSTRVTTDPSAVVAGRSAYQLDLVPRDSRSTVGSVRIAIDGSTHIPVRVQVYARGATSPAFEIGFTSFSTSTPPASTFAFTPPPGAVVKQGGSHAPSGSTPSHAKASAAAPQVVGTGWTSVVVAPVGSPVGQSGQSGQPGSLAGVLKSLPTVSGAWGSGHLLHGALFSAVLTDDGRVAIGAVPPSMLYAALAHG
jgi:outer membrane lipoprotein-sorting protein